MKEEIKQNITYLFKIPVDDSREKEVRKFLDEHLDLFSWRRLGEYLFVYWRTY